jgi:hypothetical protein
VDQPLMSFKSHIEGRNADVDVYVDRVEWERPRGLSGAKLTTGFLTGGLSLLGTGVRSGTAGSEVIPVKAISSVTTKRDGLRFTQVQLTCSGNVISFRVTHDQARAARELLTDLVLGRHPAQRQASQPIAKDAAMSARASSAGQRSIADELAKLAELRAAGVLTDDEFAAQKRKILDS